ncbi:M16 family metallopeptidase [Catenulispora rubra]|uniref:M16 family metallopeptidase n=1 Tax=Catenulispora rubra TaxID=280293 RepID=UPI0018927EB2|nr:pitrilysin family protein [Catenulispora rubra]
MAVVVGPDRRRPLVGTCLLVGAGSADERDGERGAAHLLEHLLFRIEAAGGADYSERMESIGAVGVNALTASDFTAYFSVAPSDRIHDVLRWEAKRLAPLVVSEQIHRDELRVVRNERQQECDDRPYALWLEELLAVTLLPEDSYRNLPSGRPQDLETLDLASVKTFHRRNYSARNAVLCVVGDVSPEAVMDAAEAFVNGADGLTSDGRTNDAPARHLLGAAGMRMVPAVGIPARMVFSTHWAPSIRHHDYAALTVLTGLLGRGRGSRIFRELVLRLDLIAPQEGYVDVWPLLRRPSYLTGFFSPGPDVNIDHAFDGFLAVLRDLASGKAEVTQEEVDRAVLLARHDAASSWCDLGTRSLALAKTVWTHGSGVEPGYDDKLIGAVTPEMVNHLAASVLSDDNRATICYVPSEPRPDVGSHQ